MIKKTPESLQQGMNTLHFVVHDRSAVRTALRFLVALEETVCILLSFLSMESLEKYSPPLQHMLAAI